MHRRAFIFGIAFGLATASLAARAQQPGRVYQIGFLAFGSRETTAPYLNAFEDRLRELGYVEGRNITIERRFAEGKIEQLPSLAAELVRLKVDVIMVGPAFAYFPGSAGVAASRLTKTIPIVMFVGDPVGSGLVASLARPGGNITGLSLFNPEIAGKTVRTAKGGHPETRLGGRPPESDGFFPRALVERAGRRGAVVAGSASSTSGARA